jgi:anaerobic selenocysteine-containing dehydrogenase
MTTLIERLESWLRLRTGPLTSDLVRRPGDFGLGQVPARMAPDNATTSVCGYCSTGCGLKIHLRDGQAVNLSADADYPVNLGMACPKGWEALTPLGAPDRATTPLLRNPATGRLEAVDWDRAMQMFCERFKGLHTRYGPESCAVISTGQIVTEEMALLGALWKFGMEFVHCDSNTRQCMATSHVAYKESFGFDAPPFTYADFEQSDVLVFIGANPCIAHPIMWQRVTRNRHQPEIIVIDPRKTETAMAATQHYPIRPKSDLTLLYGLANIMIASGWIRRDFIDAHTTGFAEFADFVSRFTTDVVAEASGQKPEALWRLAQTIADGKRVSFWWTMGVNQGHESTRTAQAIINLALMTGNIGRPGTGANSITGQCNAMGSRLYSNITSLFAGRDAHNIEDRLEVAAILGIDSARIPAKPSLAYDQIVDGIREGRIKGLWLIATNAVHSWVHQNEFRDLLSRLDFLVVQDLYANTATAHCADLLLPAAGWGEKEGTFINSERRIGLAKKVMRAPGEALADFQIFRLIANYWGCGEMLARWSSPEAVFSILQALSRGRPCDMSGIDGYRMLDELGGVQWPWADGRKGVSPEVERRLFGDGRFFTPDGMARFIFDPPRPAPDGCDDRYPFMLLTGRGSSAQWHTLTRTGKSDVLRTLSPTAAYVEIHPADAERHGIAPGSVVRLASRRGEMLAVAHVTPIVQEGQLFIPMHYEEVNRLIAPVFDPHSRQPSYKACAVTIQHARHEREVHPPVC